MNFQIPVFWVLFILWLLFFLASYKKNYPTSLKAKDIATDAFFIAIIAVMGFIPQVGYISVTPWLSLTLCHLPVLIGAYLFGWKKGTLYGLAFGITSWIEALLTGTGFNALFIVPWVSVLPRVVFGFLSGLTFQLLKKTPKIDGNGVAVGVISALLTCLHTVLVFLDLYAFYPSLIGSYFASSNPVAEGVALTFLGLIGLGMVGEASLAAISVPLVGKAVRKIVQSNPEK
jgi:uncharacterized membrane protein